MRAEERRLDRLRQEEQMREREEARREDRAETMKMMTMMLSFVHGKVGPPEK